MKVKSGAAISGPIFLDPLWYNEEIEKYKRTGHKTEIDLSKALTFYFDAKPKEEEYITKNLPKQDVHKLRPVIYRRNYEELVGLFKTDDSGNKDKKQNYENKFIAGNPEIEKIVDDFVQSITQKVTPDIEKLVENKAKQLWDAAARQNFLQKGNLDDWPLY
ncbi:MAG: hypothetical protein AAGI25_20945 [Bacteroidota bacterium]